MDQDKSDKAYAELVADLDNVKRSIRDAITDELQHAAYKLVEAKYGQMIADIYTPKVTVEI